QLMGREREALERLTEAITHIESGIVVAHLAGIQLDLGHHHDARQSYERYAELSPLMEEEVLKWLAARRCDTAYFLGDFATAKEQAVKADEDFYTEFRKQLDEPTHQEAAISGRLELPAADTPPGAPSPRPLELLARFWQVSTPAAP